MPWRTLLKSFVSGIAIAGVPLLPWYLLGVGVQPSVEWLTFPGYVVSYLFQGPHGMRTFTITVADCVIYTGAIYLFLRRRAKRKSQDVA